MRGSTKLSLPRLGLIVVTSFGCFLGCSKEPPPPCTVTAPTECPDPAPLYGDVAPIIGKFCASPCHYGAPAGPWPLTDYEHVADWQDVVRDQVLTCVMPPPEERSDITDAERLAILTWVRCGALP
jgi:hypothetical protein